MVPCVGEFVKFTDKFINYSPNYSSCLGRKAKILKVDGGAITIKGISYTVFYSVGGGIGSVNINAKGFSTDIIDQDVVVFEAWIEEGKKDISSLFDIVSKKKSTLSDICKKCGTMGQINRTCCICPKCGNVVWGF